MAYNFDISEEKVKEFAGFLSFLKRLAEDGVTSLVEKQLLLMLDQSLPFFSHLHAQINFPQLTRITINKNVIGSNKRIKQIKYLKYPPNEKVKRYGRCNMPQQSVFYATFNQITAFNELKPEVGDMVTIFHWRLKDKNAKLKICPIFKNHPLVKM